MKSNNKKPRGLFITGTDTAVGKTYVTQRILAQLKAQSISCVAMKPVASGAPQTEMGLRNDDALKLQQASSVQVPYDLINPYCFEPAIAPHLAAQQSGVVIQASVILEAFNELCSLAEVVIVEGVGGWQVPLNVETNEVFSVATLAEQMKLPVVLVVGLRLGCLNHAQLSYYSIYDSQCQFAGWVANNVEYGLLNSREQIQFLQQQLSVPLLAQFSLCRDIDNLENNVIADEVIDLDHLL